MFRPNCPSDQDSPQHHKDIVSQYYRAETVIAGNLFPCFVSILLVVPRQIEDRDICRKFRGDIFHEILGVALAVIEHRAAVHPEVERVVTQKQDQIKGAARHTTALFMFCIDGGNEHLHSFLVRDPIPIQLIVVVNVACQQHSVFTFFRFTCTFL